MVYCKLDGDKEIQVTSLFGQKNHLTLDAARNDALLGVGGPGVLPPAAHVPVEQRDWIFDLYGTKSVMFNALTCCAAVLIYAKDWNGDLKLFAAGHPEGGVIDDRVLTCIQKGMIDKNVYNFIQNEEVVYVVYATQSIEEDYSDYESSIEKLADWCGTNKLCVIDGFTYTMAFANAEGTIVV